MCTRYTMTFDGHDYTLRVDALTHTTTLLDSDNTPIGTIETSPCGEYFVAQLSSDRNPLGMASHHHINGTTLEEVAQSLIAGDY